MKRGKNWVKGLLRLCDSWVKMGFEISLSAFFERISIKSQVETCREYFG